MLQHPIMGDSLSSPRNHGHTLAMTWVPGDGSIDGTLGWVWQAMDQGYVAFGDGAVFNLFGQVVVGILVFGHYYKAGGILIQAMNDSRPFHSAYAGQIGAMGQ